MPWYLATILKFPWMTSLESVAAISSEWWGDGGLGQSPQRGPGAEPPEAEKKLNSDNTKPL